MVCSLLCKLVELYTTGLTVLQRWLLGNYGELVCLCAFVIGRQKRRVFVCGCCLPYST
jgi:hypothetical protein